MCQKKLSAMEKKILRIARGKDCYFRERDHAWDDTQSTEMCWFDQSLGDQWKPQGTMTTSSSRDGPCPSTFSLTEGDNIDRKVPRGGAHIKQL